MDRVEGTSPGSNYNWSGVIDFLIAQCRQSTIRENEWELEKKDLKEQIATLEANFKAQEGLNTDLVKRVKMLEVSLKKERMKFMAYLSKTNHEEREQILAELRRTDAEAIPHKAEADLSHLRPDLELSKRRAKRQRAFLEKVLKEFDCTDILEEIRLHDDDAGFFDKRNSAAELESELLASPKGAGNSADKGGLFKSSIHESNGIEVAFKLSLHGDEIKEITLADNGKRLISVGEDGKVCLLDAEGILNKKPDSLLISSSVEDSFGVISAAAKGNTLFTGSAEGKIRIWELGKSLACSDSFDFHKDNVNNLRIHSKENVLLSTSLDGTIRCIKYKPGQLIDKHHANNFVLGHSLTPSSLSWAGDGRNVFGLGVVEEADIFFFDLKSPKPSSSLKLDQSKNLSALQLQAIPNEQTYLAAGSDGKVYLIDSLANKVVQRFDAHSQRCTALAISNDGLHFASGGNDGLVKIWDRKKGKVLAEVNAHRRHQEGVINSLIFAKDQSCLLSGGADGQLVAFKLTDLF
jgi:WD40 repeat protein